MMAEQVANKYIKEYLERIPTMDDGWAGGK